MGTAFLGEHGPYFMSPGSTRRLIRNDWSWHTLPANVIYLDAPAFVGFSYSNSSSELRPELLLHALLTRCMPPRPASPRELVPQGPGHVSLTDTVVRR